MNAPRRSPPASSDTACHYCGLPVTGAAAPDEAVYCCFGCRFAAGITQSTGDQGEARWTAMALGLSVFCTMNVVMLTMALWSYAAVPQTPFEHSLAGFFRYGAMLFTAPVLLLLGRPLTVQAVDQLRRGGLSTDLLLLTGVLAAYAVSVVSTVRGDGHVYYEVACVILVLVTLGRWLEASGRLQATSALDELEQLLPDKIRRVLADCVTALVPRSAIAVGQQVRVLPGERIPVDGRVLRGRGVVDEQFFTGECVPIEKQPGDGVLGGSLNLEGDLLLEVTAPPDAGALGRLVDAVRTARLQKGWFQNLADRWSQRFFSLIAAVSLITFAIHTWRTDWETGLLTALSVVLIACPCALALATPLAIWTALDTAARRGVLFRSGEALERLAGVQAIRWDKTGTLTTGSPGLRCLLCEDEERRSQVESLAAGLTAGSTHVYSTAIRKFLEESAVLATDGEVETIAGRGLRMTTDEVGPVLLGSQAFLADHGVHFGPVLAVRLARPDAAESGAVFLGWQGRIQGAFLLLESLRPETVAAVAACRALQLDLAVLTGDRRDRAERLCAELQLPVSAELLPEQKLAAIRQAHNQFGSVAMVGDGLNDAPALAAADIGIALGCGADVTRDSADVCLLPNDLRLVPWSVEWSRRTVSTIRGNLAWSFGYNTLGVIVAAGGWLHPAVAAVLMVVSSLMVLGNSLRLKDDAVTTTDETHPSPSTSSMATSVKIGGGP
jgi:heavy metal translocating P-type ATPase